MHNQSTYETENAIEYLKNRNVDTTQIVEFLENVLAVRSFDIDKTG